MRITFPLLSLGPSGGSRVIASIANGLKEKGHEVFIVVPKGADKKYYPVNCCVIETRTSIEKKGFYYFRALIVFFEMVFAIPRSDIICATAGATSMIVWFGAKILKKGVPVYFVQNLDHLFLESKMDFLVRSLIKRSYKWFNNLVFVSEKLKKITGSAGANRVVIHPGVNDVFKPRPIKKHVRSDSPLIIWVGRKYRIKGLGDMLKAFKIVLETKKKAKLMLVTPDRLDIGKSRNISVKSLRPGELAKAYARADVFVSTSLFEGFSLPPLEAMASGTPVVTTDSVGVMEYAKNGVNAIVVPPSEPQKVADAILKVVDDKRFARKIIGEGIKTAKKFAWRKTINEFDEFFKRLVKDRQRMADAETRRHGS